ncbi:hypothetical protein ABZP36_025147 [Zizania latifolia]
MTHTGCTGATRESRSGRVPPPPRRCSATQPRHALRSAAARRPPASSSTTRPRHVSHRHSPAPPHRLVLSAHLGATYPQRSPDDSIARGVGAHSASAAACCPAFEGVDPVVVTGNSSGHGDVLRQQAPVDGAARRVHRFHHEAAPNPGTLAFCTYIQKWQLQGSYG